MQEQHDHKKYGKTMISISWILLLGLLVFIFGNWEERQINPNQRVEGYADDSSRSVTLKRNRFGHYVSAGRINGEPVVFLLDTGATDVAIPTKTAQRLGLSREGQFQVQTANGVTRAYRTRISSLTIGTITLDDVRASIVPGMGGDDILLGMSALKQLDFNQSGESLTLTQHF